MKIYWNKENNSKNLIGQRVKALRIEKHMSPKALAEQLQLAGYEFSDLTVLRIQQCYYLCFGEVCIFKQYAEFPSGRTGIPCIGSGSVAVRCRHRISWKPRNNKETFERVNLSQ